MKLENYVQNLKKEILEFVNKNENKITNFRESRNEGRLAIDSNWKFNSFHETASGSYFNLDLILSIEIIFPGRSDVDVAELILEFLKDKSKVQAEVFDFEISSSNQKAELEVSLHTFLKI